MTSRRQLLIALGLIAFPRLASSDQKVARVGFFYFGSRQSAIETGRYAAFMDAMRELGYVEGKNFVIEARFADGKSERLPELADELLRSKTDVIVATGTPAHLALKRATNTVPVVVTVTSDPILDGIAVSLAHPGGNFTGLSTGNVELFPKQVELLKLAVPRLSRLGVLWNSSNPGNPARLKVMEQIAKGAGLRTLEVGARSAEEIERGFAIMSQQRADAVIILNDTFFVQQLRQIASLALKHKVPSLWGGPEYAEVGGLMGYGQSIVENFRSAATFVDKILKGAKPSDLPFEQPMRLQLAVNRKTASAIGLAIPKELLLRADRVIE